jgi:hypothetical protein
MDGKFELLKGGEEDLAEQHIIWAYSFYWGLRWPFTACTQVAGEEELGASMPTVFQENHKHTVFDEDPNFIQIPKHYLDPCQNSMDTEGQKLWRPAHNNACKHIKVYNQVYTFKC